MKKFMFSMLMVLITTAFMNGQGTPDTRDYLHFVSLKGGDTVRLDKYEWEAGILTAQLEYSTDNRQNWNDYAWNEGIGTSIALTNAGDTVWFRAGQGGTAGKNATFSTNFSSYYYFRFGSNDSIAAGGNIMSLYDGTCQQDSMTTMGFFYLFLGCEALMSAPLLPATKMANFCYNLMFGECESLKTAPLLPATELAESCYNNMFYGCTSLTQAPSLPATQLAENCYTSMFQGCTSLTKAPSLSATALETKCYASMFRDCNSLITAPELPATTMKEECYSGMFNGCTSLKTAPSLQVTELAEYCFFYMFRNCTSLKVDTCDGSCAGAMLLVPDTTQEPSNWNANMFKDCQGDSKYTSTYGIKIGGSYTIMGKGFTLTVEANDTTMGSVTGGGIYDCGDTVTITATAKAGYKFVGWSTGDTAATHTFIMFNQDSTITATFALASGVEEIEVEKYVAYAEDGSIIVNGVTGCSVAIYDMNGRMVGKIEKANETERFAVGISGVYVVTVDNKAEAKVIVK